MTNPWPRPCACGLMQLGRGEWRYVRIAEKTGVLHTPGGCEGGTHDQEDH